MQNVYTHAMHAFTMRTMPESIFKIERPTALLTSEGGTVVRSLTHSGRTQKSIEMKIRQIFVSGEIKDSLGPAKEFTNQILGIFGASRCIIGLDREPTVSTIAHFSNLNRNLVSNFASALEPMGLIEKKHGPKRSEIISPTRLADLYSDIILGSSGAVIETLKQVGLVASSGQSSLIQLESLEIIETAFDFAKQIYPSNTLNYSIIDNFHDQIVMLIGAVRRENVEEAKKIIDELIDGLKARAEARRKAEEMGLKPLLLQDTGERVGRGRVFRPARKR